MLQALLGRFADIAEVLMKAHIAITPFFFLQPHEFNLCPDLVFKIQE
jgi:hypothetical protein